MSEVNPEPAIIETGFIPEMHHKDRVIRYYGYVAITDEEIALENREELRRMNEIMAQ